MRHAARTGTQSAPDRSFARPRIILALFGLLLLMVPVMLSLRAGIGVETPPDGLLGGFTADQLYSILDAEGDGGRFYHLLFQLADLFLIATYVAFYAASIAYWFRRLLGRHSRIVVALALLPVLAGLVDYAENAGLVTLLLWYPDTLPWLADLTGWFTQAKWALTGACLLLATFGMLGVSVRAAYTRLFARTERVIDASYVRVEPSPVPVSSETVAAQPAKPAVQPSTEDDRFYNARTIKLTRGPELMAALHACGNGQRQATPPRDEAADTPTMTFAWGPELLASLRDAQTDQRGASANHISLLRPPARV